MAIQERDLSKQGVDAAAPAPAAGPAWLHRLNAYGEKHATAIIAVSTALIILTVLIFAKYYYDKSQIERAEQELAQAESIEQLVELKTRFGTTPAGPRISYRLASRYYDDGKLDAARKEYQEFKARYPADRLMPYVARALSSLDRNEKFDAEGREALLKQHRLLSHPRQISESKDPRFSWGPLPAAKPVVEIELPGGVVKAELFEDEAPNAVAAFIKLAGEKHFDGLKLDVVPGERLRSEAKSGAPELLLALEDSKQPAEAYSLVLSRKDAGVSGSQFEILLRAHPDLKDATVFGRVTDGSDALKTVKKDDAIKSLKVVSKRDHPYEPQPLKK